MATVRRQALPLFTLVALLAGGVLLHRALDRPVTDIRIEGVLSPAERALLQSALQPFASTRILSADLAALVAAVEALGWPEDVSVRRVWPRTLALSVRRQSIVARWADDAYLTSGGQVIEQADVSTSLPVLRVAPRDPALALATLQQLDALARAHGLRVSALDFAPAQGWRLTQSDGVPVQLGSGPLADVLLPRYRRFLRVRGQLPSAARAALEYADARYDSGVAIKPGTGAEPLLLGQAGRSDSGLRSDDP
ncbi:MAG: cell division protein FtsQ/DivIB [Pseudomonadota bacterium]